VDPYYLIDKAQVYGVFPRIMSAARRLNDDMGDYVANQVIKLMNKKGILVKNANILILGITFKENCPDVRNTKVIDIYKVLKGYNINITVYDPFADEKSVRYEYGIDITKDCPQQKFDGIIAAVAHNCFIDLDILSLLKEHHIIYDIKSFLEKSIIDGRL
jgi:UDP-N-acetyl-D-galactosamine dehydrogenase